MPDADRIPAVRLEHTVKHKNAVDSARPAGIGLGDELKRSILHYFATALGSAYRPAPTMADVAAPLNRAGAPMEKPVSTPVRTAR